MQLFMSFYTTVTLNVILNCKDFRFFMTLINMFIYINRQFSHSVNTKYKVRLV